MLKAEIKKEIEITNKEIAHYLFIDGDLLEHMDEILEDMLYDDYGMDYDTRCDAVAQLALEDYIEILEALVDELREELSANASS